MRQIVDPENVLTGLLVKYDLWPIINTIWSLSLREDIPNISPCLQILRSVQINLVVSSESTPSEGVVDARAISGWNPTFLKGAVLVACPIPIISVIPLNKIAIMNIHDLPIDIIVWFDVAYFG